MTAPRRGRIEGVLVDDEGAAVLLPALRRFASELIDHDGARGRRTLGQVADLLQDFEDAAARHRARFACAPIGGRSDGAPSELTVMSTSDAAERLIRSPKSVRELIERGDLIATKHGRDWIITAAAVDRYLERNNP
jgi:excisionase family DNA binding protein